jgi:hypothetical protein
MPVFTGVLYETEIIWLEAHSHTIAVVPGVENTTHPIPGVNPAPRNSIGVRLAYIWKCRRVFVSFSVSETCLAQGNGSGRAARPSVPAAGPGNRKHGRCRNAAGRSYAVEELMWQREKPARSG